VEPAFAPVLPVQTIQEQTMPPTKRNRRPHSGRTAEPARIRRFDAHEGTLAAARRLFNDMESGATSASPRTDGEENSIRIAPERHRLAG
jgi:hypothetical protein